MTPVWNDPINMPDDFSRPIYLLRKGKKFNEMFILEARPQEQKKEPEFNFGEPQISRKEWLNFCEKNGSMVGLIILMDFGVEDD